VNFTLRRRGYATAALALTGGIKRKLIAIRFQALMVAISTVRLMWGIPTPCVSAMHYLDQVAAMQ